MWVKLDDNFAEHPKLAGISASAAMLYVAALCHCGRLLTDGRVDKRYVSTLLFEHMRCGTPVDQLARELVAAKLWKEHAEHFEVHDFLAYNPTRAAVEAERAAARDRVARNRSGEVRKNQRGSSRERTVNRDRSSPAPSSSSSSPRSRSDMASADAEAPAPALRSGASAARAATPSVHAAELVTDETTSLPARRSGTHELRQDFERLFAQHVAEHGLNARATWSGRCGAEAKRLISAHGLDECRRRLAIYFSAPPPFLAKGSRDFSGFAMHFDKLALPTTEERPRGASLGSTLGRIADAIDASSRGSAP